MSSSLVSPATTITIIAGALISIFYLRYMWSALQRAVLSINKPEDGRTDAFAHSFIGAIVAVVASSLAIASYGLSPQFLYLGVLLALIAPIAVSYTFYRELQD
jgi:hypothetical protein